MRIPIVSLVVVLAILLAASYVSTVSAGPSGCNCTSWSHWAAAGEVAGMPTCHGCPDPDHCEDLEEGPWIKTGTMDDPDACIRTVGIGRTPPDGVYYQSPADACWRGNMHLFEWDETGGGTPATADCHFAGESRDSNGRWIVSPNGTFQDISVRHYEYGLPWCLSVVDTTGTLTGIADLGGAAFGPAMIAIMWHGAPGWRDPNKQRFYGDAIDIFGKSCFRGSGLNPQGLDGELAFRYDEIQEYGYTPASTTINTGFCLNLTTFPFFMPVAQHRCRTYDLD